MTRNLTSIGRMLATKTFKKIAAAALGIMVLAPAAQAHDRFGFDFHGDHGRIGIGFNIVAPPPVVQQTARVWIDPVYRTECDRVWVPPVTQDVCDRVWVDATYQTRDVVYFSHGRRVISREQVCVAPGHYEDRHRAVVLADGHFDNVERQVLVSAGHWEDRVVYQAACP